MEPFEIQLILISLTWITIYIWRRFFAPTYKRVFVFLTVSIQSILFIVGYIYISFSIFAFAVNFLIFLFVTLLFLLGHIFGDFTYIKKNVNYTNRFWLWFFEPSETLFYIDLSKCVPDCSYSTLHKIISNSYMPNEVQSDVIAYIFDHTITAESDGFLLIYVDKDGVNVSSRRHSKLSLKNNNLDCCLVDLMEYQKGEKSVNSLN